MVRLSGGSGALNPSVAGLLGVCVFLQGRRIRRLIGPRSHKNYSLNTRSMIIWRNSGDRLAK